MTNNKNPDEIKKKMKEIDKKISKLEKSQWTYSKKLMKFGLASVIFGLSTFTASLILYGGPLSIFKIPPLSVSLLTITPIGPLVLIALLSMRFRDIIDELERKREQLSSNYKRKTLKKLDEKI